MKENLAEGVIRNSFYNFAINLITKIGGLVFTIILARLLMPELFGVYNLVLSIFLIASIFADVGITNASLRYLAEFFGRNNLTKVRSYFRYFLKIKGLTTVLVILILLLFSRFISYTIFNKPAIFFPLLFSCLYLLVNSFSILFQSIFLSLKDLRKVAFLELSFQSLRIIFAFLAVYLFSNDFVVSGIFLGLMFSVFFTLLINFILLKDKKNLFFGNTEDVDKKRIFNYVRAVGVLGITFTIFGAVDTLMLGRFVEASYIGYYRAALSLVIAVSSLLIFSNLLLPVFTQIQGNRFERGFSKTLRYLLVFTIPAVFGVIMVAKYFIFLIYGKEYLVSYLPLYALAPLILISSLIGFYTSVFEAREKVNNLVKFIFISLGLNIILNYVLIKGFLPFGQEYSILGAGIATTISRGVYLFAMVLYARKLFNLKPKKSFILKPAISSVLMVCFLFAFEFLVEDMNLFFGILEILLGGSVYFGAMFLFKGIEKKDLKLISSLLPKII